MIKPTLCYVPKLIFRMKIDLFSCKIGFFSNFFALLFIFSIKTTNSQIVKFDIRIEINETNLSSYAYLADSVYQLFTIERSDNSPDLIPVFYV